VIRLPPQPFDQRIATAEVAFRGLGHVHVADPGAIPGMPRTISIGVDHPGWGIPTAALLEFVERWIFSGGSWELTRYAYELRIVPGPGRLAFHWHDGLYHTHCVDPNDPARDHHYQGGPVDLFAAYQAFGRMLASGSSISCQALTPLRGQGA
jgi:hypothetical protein